jgi:DNA-binding MarR family transcriptional regulator
MSDNRAEDLDISKVANIDKIIHEPGRLAILVYLSMVEFADFLFITNITGLTKGNLSAHMSKLEKVGYIEIIKEFIEKKPHTVLRITPQGQKALDEYRKQMSKIM